MCEMLGRLLLPLLLPLLEGEVLFFVQCVHSMCFAALRPTQIQADLRPTHVKKQMHCEARSLYAATNPQYCAPRKLRKKRQARPAVYRRLKILSSRQYSARRWKR